MSSDDSDQKGRNIDKNFNSDKIVVADDDNVPHLENMANVQGSNKNTRSSTPDENAK